MATEIVSFTRLPSPEPTQPATERLVHGTPKQNVWNVFSDPSAQFHAGCWSSGCGAWRVNYTEHEFCHLLAGKVRIESASGIVCTFDSGDSFVVPSGFRGVWTVLEPVSKIYVIFEPKIA